MCLLLCSFNVGTFLSPSTKLSSTDSFVFRSVQSTGCCRPLCSHSPRSVSASSPSSSIKLNKRTTAFSDAMLISPSDVKDLMLLLRDALLLYGFAPPLPRRSDEELPLPPLLLKLPLLLLLLLTLLSPLLVGIETGLTSRNL